MEDNSQLLTIVKREYTNFYNWAVSSKILKKLESKNDYIVSLFATIKNNGLNEEQNVNMNIETEKYKKILNDYQTNARSFFPMLIKVYPNLVELFIDIEHKLYPIETVVDVVTCYVNYNSGFLDKEDIVDIASTNMNKYVSGCSKEVLRNNMFN